MKICTLLMGFALILSQHGAFAQQQTIQGTVTDLSTEETLPGVNILVKGTTIGTVTDVDGNYRLTAPEDADILVFSSVGYNSEEITINGQTTINMSLAPDIKSLSEVVVVGYGTLRKENMTGSVSTIESEALQRVPAPSFEQALQGAAPGLNVSSSAGNPGAASRITIRGVNSISSGVEPLFIIDGVPIQNNPSGYGGNGNNTGVSPLAMINPNDIASVEVLKDAAATSLYGSRGSNGVVLITTKSGTQGQSAINVSYQTGVSNLARDFEDIGLANTRESIEIFDRAYAFTGENGGMWDPGIVINLFPTNAFGETQTLTREEALNTNTDWQEAAMQTGSFHDVNASLSTGFEKGSLYASFNFREDEGVMRFHDLRRYSGRINFDFNPYPIITLGTNLSVSYLNSNRVQSASSFPAFGNQTGFAGIADFAQPWLPVRSEVNPTGYWNGRANMNILAHNDTQFRLNELDQYRVLGNVSAELRIPGVEGLSIRSELGTDIILTNTLRWDNSLVTTDNISNANEQNLLGTILNYNVYATYDRQFNDNHQLTLVAGTESQTTQREQRSLGGRQLTGPFQELGNPVERTGLSSGLVFEDYLRSYFSRVNYTFLDRFLLGGSFRVDGSSRFLGDNRWASFAAGSAGWIISREGFFEPIEEVVNFLKVRASFGQTGNRNVNPGAFENQFNNISYGGFVEGFDKGVNVQGIGTRDLTWETTDAFDVGLDFGLLQDRINGSVGYYYQYVDDLLLQVGIPPSGGVGSIWANVGTMENQGFEFTVSTTNIIRPNFSWKSQINLTTNRNEVLALDPSVDVTGQGIRAGSTLTKTGEPIGTFFIPRFAGIDPDRGVILIQEVDRPLFDSTGVTQFTGETVEPTADNVVDNNRYIQEGKTNLPTYFGSITNSFQYRNFDLSFTLNFSGGNYIYDSYLQTRYFPDRGIVRVHRDLLTDSWEPGRTDATLPQLSNGRLYTDADGNPYNVEPTNDQWLYRGDFLRLRSLSLGYNLPTEIASAIKLQALRVYFTGTNLLTFTDYPGFDPEIASIQGTSPDFNSSQRVNLGQGIVTNSLPVPNLRTYSVGINVTF
ncbi:MAG: TonB-dependent receptor [Bacteroidota bacterium]